MEVMENKLVAVFLGHPAHFHLFKKMANNLISKGYQVDFLVKRKDIVEQLVKESGFNYYVVRSKERKGSSIPSLVWAVLSMDIKVSAYLIKKRPKILMGTFGRPLVCKFLGIPSITCNEDDADVVPRFASITYPGTSTILVPSVCDCGKWNEKAIKYNSYHELAYLHPNTFKPDLSVVQKYFTTDEPYFIMRFAKLNAHHDGGIKGITTEIAQRLIDILKPHGKIFITSERTLEKQFEPYRINIDPIDIHHVLAFASLYIGDSQTMAAEAGVLGTPFVRFNDFVGRIGYLHDLESTYHLGYGIKTNEVERLYSTVEELVNISNIRERYKARKERMLAEKIDYAAFLTWFVDNYPESHQIMKDNSDYQFHFK